MKRPHVVFLAALLCCLSAPGAFAMDYLACSVSLDTGDVDASLAGRLCDAVAGELDARLVGETEMQSLIEDMVPVDPSDRFHRISASVISRRAISFSYAFGDADEWRNGQEQSHADLQVDVMDADIGAQAIALLADTIGRLSRR